MDDIIGKNYTDEEIFQYIKSNNQKIRALCAVVLEWLKQNENDIVRDCFLAAKEGRMTPRMSRGLHGYEVIKKLREINRLERANYYIYYEYYIRFKVIPMYHQISNASAAYKELLPGLLDIDISNIKESEFKYGDVKDKLIDWHDRKSTKYLFGITTTVNHYNEEEDIKTLDDLGNYYSPVCFDVEYSMVKSLLDGKNVIRKMDYRTLLGDFKTKIRELLTINSVEYQKSRIRRMDLISGEREYFEVTFRQFVEKLRNKKEEKKPDDGQGRIGK